MGLLKIKLYFPAILVFLLMGCRVGIEENVENWETHSTEIVGYGFEYKIPKNGIRRLRRNLDVSTEPKNFFIEVVDYGGSEFEVGKLSIVLGVSKFNELPGYHQSEEALSMKKFVNLMNGVEANRRHTVVASRVEHVGGYEWLREELVNDEEYFIHFARPLDGAYYLNANVTYLGVKDKRPPNKISDIQRFSLKVVESLKAHNL